MDVKLFTTHCPKCSVLKAKLDEKGIQYEEIDDVKAMRKRGFLEAPKLEVDELVYDFKQAIDWVNER